jgi:small subunit ribosomal protein S21
LAKIIVQPGQSMDDIISKFGKQVRKSGMLNDVRKREYYVKPGVKRKLKSMEAQKNKAKNKNF